MNPKLPELYSLPKLHKPNTPMRPIVTFINTPTEKLSKCINNFFSKIIQYKPKHAVLNSKEITNEISNTTLPKSYILASFDITNLYTNVPLQDTIDITKNILKDNLNNEKDIKNITKIIEHCTEQNICTFKNKTYKMIDGLPMGSPLSGLLANIYVEHIEDKILNLPEAKNVIMWKRYVDDILIIWTGTLQELKNFHDSINTIDHKIKFTIETEENNKINFLDLTLNKSNNGQITYNIYRKPTNAECIIPYDSHHSTQNKFAALHSMINRAYTLPLSDQTRHTEIEKIRNIAQTHNFPEKTINKIINKIKNKTMIQSLGYGTNTTIDNNNITFRKFTYAGQINEKISKTLKKYNIHPIHKTNNSISDILHNYKDKTEKWNKNGVYKIYCKECEATYIGETGRKLSTRLQEHKKDKIHSNVGRHIHYNGHHIDEERTKILHVCDKGLKLTLLEAFEIDQESKTNTKCLNDQLELKEPPIFKYIQNNGNNRPTTSTNRQMTVQ